ncbi:hypothetical protein [Plasticicumulans acidivorans]|uniref:Uncharacterized protein n=1 Tax=Plasticicumulans acidivorans TaxID=886464 RepID=A0A317MXW8_9GAMM|nr:hypothetical protein [Plasticicumulans acidivorans]PWV64549.1 hypothetical protein C7443_102199 [Plasticicumulans acidivorans]
MHRKPKQHWQEDAIALSSAAAGANVVHPNTVAQTVTDPAIIDRGCLYAEAINQTRPLAKPGAEALRIADMVRDGTARPHGLTQTVAERMATSGRSLDSFINGANPRGKAAEVVVTSDYRALHVGHDTGIVNPPEHVAQNLRDIRLAPDAASRKDLVFAFETKNGDVLWKYNGQVKTGGAQYVSDTLVEMAKTPGYGKVGYVDARYVNPDGTPRVAPDAFTSGQARRLQGAEVRLRGVSNLEKRADQLMADIESGKRDGLAPVARQELQQLRDDIAAAYRARGVVSHIGGGAVIAAASAAVVSLVVQLATEGKVDAKTVGKSAGTGAIFGAGGAAADASFYHFGTEVRELVPEAATEFAKQGVAIGFCVLAVGTDLISEIRAACRGDVTVAGAVGGTAAKTALDLLPLVMAPLGLAGLPVLVGAQVGGRWLIGKTREADRVLEQAIAADVALAENITQRMTAFTQVVEDMTADCVDTDALFNQVMGPDSCEPWMRLHLLKN